MLDNFIISQEEGLKNKKKGVLSNSINLSNQEELRVDICKEERGIIIKIKKILRKK